jgi:hypothetical protein
MATDIAIISPEELAKLASETGAQQTTGSFIPQLKVNYDEEDANGKEIKKGTFIITGQDKTVYAKTAKFRPLTHHFQWVDFDDVAKKVTNRTRFVTTLLGSDEPRDEKGTLKCGKPASKDLKANPALAKKYESITCYRTVQGLATIEGETAEGEKVKLEGVECALRLKGANFAPFEEEYFSKLGQGYVWDHELTLSASKEKNGASTYYVIHYDTDFKDRKPLTVELYDKVKSLQARISEANQAIDTKYFNAIHNKQEVAKDAKLVESTGVDFGDELDNDIPF